MSEHGFTLFETPIGRCGIAWNGLGIAALQLPEARESETRARLVERVTEARELVPPAEVAAAIASIVALLSGEKSDLSTIALDMTGIAPFHRRVYEAARKLEPGMTLSYGEIAEKAGAPGAARAVGQAVRRNPFAIIVPCHRILAAGGKIGGYSANGGIATKLRLLAIEGRQVNGTKLFEGDGAFGFDVSFAVDYLRDADVALGRLIAKVGPFRMQLKQTPNIFMALAEAIVYQQLTGKAAATIFARVRALFPRAHEAPTPEQIMRTSDAKLRGAGLSGSKTLSLRDLARKTLDGTVPSLAEIHRLDDEAIIERLTAVRGIGRWTAEMLLIFRLGRPDVLPVDDYGVRKGFGVILNKKDLPTRQELQKCGERWKPYRTVASWYLWRAAEAAPRQQKKALKPRVASRSKGRAASKKSARPQSRP